MLLFNVDWREEMLLYPAVKQAVSSLARVTAWGYVALALLWLTGLLFLVCCLVCVSVVGAEAAACIVSGLTVATLSLSFLSQLLYALLLPCLYVAAIWCHEVLLAGRGLVVTRCLLILLLFFSFLYPVCEIYTAVTGGLLLPNQFILPAVLTTSLAAAVVMNWGCMIAAPLRLRVLLVLFGGGLVLSYLAAGSVAVLLLPCFAWLPLRSLARYALLVVSLPPVEK